MTFKEKLAQEHPEYIGSFTGNAMGCPYAYGYEEKPTKGCKYSNLTCTECWNREMPEEEKKVFTKDDLKDGMIVETREGNRYFFFNGRMRRENWFLDLSDYDSNLKGLFNHKFDIMKVFKSKENWVFKDVLKEPGDLIWERKITKEITVEEAVKLSKEKFPEYGEIKITV